MRTLLTRMLLPRLGKVAKLFIFISEHRLWLGDQKGENTGLKPPFSGQLLFSVKMLLPKNGQKGMTNRQKTPYYGPKSISWVSIFQKNHPEYYKNNAWAKKINKTLLKQFRNKPKLPLFVPIFLPKMSNYPATVRRSRT